MALEQALVLSELTEGRGKQVTVGGQKIAVFLCEGQVYAIDDTCPHRGAPLSDGECRMGQVMCPWHAARFDLKTGKALCPPARSDVRAYRVELSGQDIYVDVGSSS
jgi:3-phenylpropionate/trans-cinnamate dioxygenase ferredoxin subunit